MILIILLLICVKITASGLVKLTSAKQSSLYGSSSSSYVAEHAIDGKLSTRSKTNLESNAWLRAYFEKYSKVEEVVVQKGIGYGAACTYNVYVCEKDNSTLCGTYTKSNDMYYNETVQCGGAAGDSVMLKQTGCTQYLNIYEITVHVTIAPCNAGSYMTTNGCTKCPAGKISSKGSTSAASCYYAPCNAGSYMTIKGCTKCPADTWSSAAATICTKCADDKISNNGSTSANSCYYGLVLIKRLHQEVERTFVVLNRIL